MHAQGEMKLMTKKEKITRHKIETPAPNRSEYALLQTVSTMFTKIKQLDTFGSSKIIGISCFGHVTISCR